MRVRLYEVDQTTGAMDLVDADCDLEQCFADDRTEYHSTKAELEKIGRAWVGGGAAQLYYLSRIAGQN